MILEAAYLLTGFVVAIALIIELLVKKTDSIDVGDRFILCMIAVISCSFFWPIILPTLILFKLSEWAEDTL